MRKLLYYMALCACLLVPGLLHAQIENTGKITLDTISLEKGNGLEVYMRLNLGELYVNPGLSVEVTPLLLGESDTLALPPVLVNGRTRQLLYERGTHKNAPEYNQVIRRRNRKEQLADYTAHVRYEEWMEQSHLLLVTDLCGCGWEVLQKDTMLFTRRVFEPKLVYIAPEYEAVKQRELVGSAFLDFPVNKTVIYPEYRNNPRELKQIQATIDSVRNNRFATITAVSIMGYASPEGTYERNARLAQGRAEALLDYVRQLYDFGDVEFSVSSVPEDWDGLRRMTEASFLPEKEQVLAIIDGTDIFAGRERKLMDLKGGVVYRFMLREWFPALRHSDYTVKYTVRNFTLEEAKELFYTDPRQLSLEEMYRISQTYEPGSDAFNEVFDIAVSIYPNDGIANLNAANAALLRRDTEAARSYLDRAVDCGETLLAKGVLAYYEGDSEAAVKFFEQAKAAGITEAEDNLEFIRSIPQYVKVHVE